MNKTFSLLFYVKKSKVIANGTAPIYLRITIDGKQTEIAAKRYINPGKWNSGVQKVNGGAEDIRTLNSYLKTLEQQVYEAQHQLLKDKEPVTTENLKNKLFGVAENPRMLMPIFQDHNNKIKALLGEEFSPGTLCRYTTALKHTTEFLQWKYRISDIDIRKIDHAFITEFEFYLRSVRKCNNNSAVKYVKNFGKIIRICISNNWLDKDPFVNYKSKFREVVRAFLSQDEIDAIAAKEFSIERLNQVRDIFLFSCYTGLAYIDVKQLTRNNIGVGIDAEKWIFTSRQKTDTQSNIPLLPMAEEVLNKYKNHPLCINEKSLLPVLSNQKMNSYLKEIANVCGITKELTFHIARHTFATTVTLTNGVSIESVSKMLGHRSIKTTQHYAKILDRKVSDDMKQLREKFKIQNSVSETRTRNSL
jgi:site-specific recombinase XerD